MKAISATLMMCLCFLSIGAVTPTIIESNNTSDCDLWVDSVYNSLTLREKIAQLIFPKVNPKMKESTKSQLDELIGENQFGGLLFSQGTLEEYVTMTNYAQSLAKTPLLMTFDGEWGLSMRIPETPRFPKNMALGAGADEEMMFEYGFEMAREARAAGIHVNFAPVIDVNSNPNNPVIADRSFGSDPERVARLGIAYSKGLEAGGVQAVAKHFPGHGDTSTDSHTDFTMVNMEKSQLDSVHLYPFRKYIEEGLSGIMVGHIAVPTLDPTLTPASLSSVLTDSLLKNEIGFEGLIYTDALSMRGAKVEEPQNNAFNALIAGCDVMESSRTPVADLDFIIEKFENGVLPETIIEERCKKLLRYKYLLGLNYSHPIELDGLLETINYPHAEKINRKLSQSAITVIKNDCNLLPLDRFKPQSIALLKLGNEKENNSCEMIPEASSFDTYDTISHENIHEILNHDVIVADIFDTELNDCSSLDLLYEAGHLILVFFVNPYKLQEFIPLINSADAVILAYDNTPLLQEYATKVILGLSDANGKLPVTLDSIATIGTGLSIESY